MPKVWICSVFTCQIYIFIFSCLIWLLKSSAQEEVHHKHCILFKIKALHTVEVLSMLQSVRFISLTLNFHLNSISVTCGETLTSFWILQARNDVYATVLLPNCVRSHRSQESCCFRGGGSKVGCEIWFTEHWLVPCSSSSSFQNEADISLDSWSCVTSGTRCFIPLNSGLSD